jgi:hypothetical protein
MQCRLAGERPGPFADPDRVRDLVRRGLPDARLVSPALGSTASKVSLS